MKQTLKITLTLTADTDASPQDFLAAVQSAFENAQLDGTSQGFVGENEDEITIEAFAIPEDQ